MRRWNIYGRSGPRSFLTLPEITRKQEEVRSVAVRMKDCVLPPAFGEYEGYNPKDIFHGIRKNTAHMTIL
jgi:hypothetical protein